MEKILTTIFCILTLVEYISFYYVIYKKKIQITRIKVIGLLVCVLILAIACLGWNGWLMGLGQGLVFFVCFFAMFFLFNVSIKENAKLWLAALMILVLIEGMADDFVRIFITVGELDAMIIYLLCVLAMLWIYHFLIGRKLDRNLFQLPKRIRGIIAVMACVLILMMNFMGFVLSELAAYKLARIGEVFLFIGSIAICVLLFSLIYYFNVTQHYSMRAEILERQNEQQREYFEQLLKKEQDTRQFRHDLIAELLELKNFSQKKEYEKLDDYLTEMLGGISEISKRQYDVGNDIVNTIINYYFLPIKELCNIRVRGYMQEEQVITQRDLCIVISNLVKNAVEAVEKLQVADRKILFEVQQGKKALNIHMENTMIDELKMKDGLPVTTKEDKRNHGLGLWNVRTVIEKYKGSYTFKTENHWYVLDIFLES